MPSFPRFPGRARRAFLLMALLAGGARAATPLYVARDLGTLGGDYAIAYGINNAGAVTGFSYDGPQAQGGAYTAFVYSGGQMRALNFSDRTYTAGYAINGTGHVAGIGNWLPWYFDSQRLDIDVASIGDGYGYALALNDANQVAGESQSLQRTATGGYVTQAFFWSGPGTRVTQGLGRLGGNRAGARGIDPGGVVVGYSQYGSSSFADQAFSFPWNPGHAFVRRPDAPMVDLNELTQCGQPQSGEPFASLLELMSATAINANGLIVGLAGPKLDATVRRAFLAEPVGCATTPGAVETRYLTSDLGTFANGGISYALALNRKREVVGAAYRDASGAGNFEAALFSGGSVLNLNDAIADSIYAGNVADPWRLREATGINDSGQIVGWGEHLGQTRAFLLIPIAQLSVTPVTRKAGGPSRLGVEGQRFAQGASVQLRVMRGTAAGAVVARGTVTASADGQVFWGATVACGFHYVVTALDLSTGVDARLAETDTTCYPQ